MVSKMYKRFACWILALVVVNPLWPARAGDADEKAFPFGSELMLDASPLYGSKRVPIIEIEENGDASIDLWCASVRGQATVGANSITIVAQPPADTQCPPERQTGDQNLLTELTQVTGWRRNGDTVELSGPTNLRFHLMTN
jgi:heat shock protein HslJ